MYNHKCLKSCLFLNLKLQVSVGKYKRFATTCHKSKNSAQFCLKWQVLTKICNLLMSELNETSCGIEISSERFSKDESNLFSSSESFGNTIPGGSLKLKWLICLFLFPAVMFSLLRLSLPVCFMSSEFDRKLCVTVETSAASAVSAVCGHTRT